jgi:phasin family protein
MNIERIVEMTAGVREQAGAYASRAADVARERAEKAAAQVEAVRTPVETLTDTGLKLNSVAHHYVAQLLHLQASMVKGALKMGAQRLRTLSKADSLQQAYQSQAIDLAAARERAVGGARDTWEIVAESGREVSGLLNQAYAQLAHPVRARRTVRKPAAKATARRAAPKRPRAKARKTA